MSQLAKNAPGEDTTNVNWEEIIAEAPCSPVEQSGAKISPYISPDIELTELRNAVLLRLRSLTPVHELNRTLAANNIQLPPQTLQSAGADPSAMCLAPGEWLLFSEFLDIARLTEMVLPASGHDMTRLLDLSCAYCVFRLSGPACRWLLAKLCCVDFSDRAMGVSHATRTRMQHIPVTLHYHSPGGHKAGPVFDVICERSTALYLWQLLVASIPHAEQLQQQLGHLQGNDK